MTKILVIPDPQIKEDSNLSHLKAAGMYAVDHKPDVIVAIGDWCDTPSLSKYNSQIEQEGLRLKKDIEAGKRGLLELMSPILEYNIQKKKNKEKQYKPRLIFTTGNHCPSVRIKRFISENPVLEGYLSETEFDDFAKDLGFEMYGFLEIVEIEGIRFSHYFINPHSAKKAPLSGSIDTMLKNAGFSFVMGHQQGLKLGKHYLGDGTKRIGIVAGSFYLEDESFMGVQGNKAHWRGIVMLNEAKDGCADICEISMNYLLKKYKDK